MERDLRRDEGAAGVPTDQPHTPSIRWCQLIASALCLAGIAMALRWSAGWGVTLATGGYLVAVVLEWIRSAGIARDR